jgi:hypothetical protein
MDLSDSCCVTSQDGEKSINCDVVVCAVPLGILKEAIDETYEEASSGKRLEFDPPLPFVKRDAIRSVGFGLLDKVYLQFPSAFWRGTSQDDDTVIFGNDSGVNPHHYMFFDVGKTLGRADDMPAVLMTLISGNEAVDCERLSSKELVADTLRTLQTIFSDVTVPEPIAYKTTNWGKDRFSRGSYTYLPPGSTDDDFSSLKSPINGNGDSILLDGSETMRVFFAGEHTTALHPSMAHGAMLSGFRAGEEVVSSLSHGKMDSFDRLIPMPLFRYMSPEAPLECSFCHVPGSRAYEGPLFAFKRGSRMVLAHNCCAEYSPEVEVLDGKWKHVVKAVNRSSSIECFACRDAGASIGCSDEDCDRSYHFKCAEKTSWRFEREGKEFYCPDHRDEEQKGQANTRTNGFFQHSLFAMPSGPSVDVPGNLDMGEDGTRPSPFESPSKAVEPELELVTGNVEAEGPVEQLLVRVQRPSLGDRWNLELTGVLLEGKHYLAVAFAPECDPYDKLMEGDLIVAINGERLGSKELQTIDSVVSRLGQEVDVLFQVQREL